MNMTDKIAIAASATLAIFLLQPAGASAETAFPEACKSPDVHMPSGAMHMPGAMTDYQKATMDGMKDMDANMMQGMMKKDADVAFVCGMIAHHMGAISMAEAELKYGDNEWAKESASKIIDAQTKEIAEMVDWLKREAK
jgi:uncharacterized protein (DUF305 family)